MTAEHAAAIKAVLVAQDAAWSRGDAAAFGADASDEVVFTNILGMFSVGREPFVRQHEHIFATVYRGSSLRQTLAHIAFVRPDVAVVDTLTEVTGFAALPPGVAAHDGALRTRLEQVMTCEDGRWMVAAFHNVTISPAAVVAVGTAGTNADAGPP